MIRRLTLLALLAGVLLSGCNLPPAASPASSPDFVVVTRDPDATATPTPFRPLAPTATPSLVPSPTVTPTPVPTDTPLPTLTFTPTATLEPSSRANYYLEVTFDYYGRSLSVRQTVRYPNQTDRSMGEIVLAVEPNRWENCFDLQSLSVDSEYAKSYELSGNTLTIELSRSLEPGEVLVFSMAYSLCVPYKTVSTVFGYNGYQINLTDWYPYIVPYSPGEGWLQHAPSGVGEYQVYDAVDVELNLKFSDPENIPVVAASAPAEANGEWTRYRAYGVRNFVLSASPDYIVSNLRVGDVDVNSYYFARHQSGGWAILDEAALALTTYGDTFAPYPYGSLSIVETDYPDGLEFSGLVFMSDDFYAEYNGTPRGNLTAIGVHEIAHQWWYSLVGNDQALEPWLDEALAVYAERIFFETNYPDSLNWWWNFRVKYFNPTGWVDSSIYNGGAFRPYTDAVYLRGALFLEDLRARIGDEDFRAFLKDYAAQMSFRLAAKSDFFRILDAHTNTDYSDLVQGYFMEFP